MNPRENSGLCSLLDYGLIDGDNVNSVSSFVIDENARFRCGSDHALLQCEMEFSGHPRINWTYDEVVRYNINERTNYEKFKTMLDEKVQSVSLTSFSKLTPSAMLPHLVESLTSSARVSIGIVIRRANAARMYTIESCQNG